MKVLIADDHAIVRRGLKQILSELQEKPVVGEASSSSELFELLPQRKWDMVILDISMPGKNAFETIKEIKATCPPLPVLVLSMHPEDQFAMKALQAGASGYLNKGSTVEELPKAILKILGGGVYTSPHFAECLAQKLLQGEKKEAHETLSHRESQVLNLFVSGKSFQEIAGQLSISVKTVGTYRNRVLEKLNLKSNVELVKYALQHHLVE